MATLAELRTLVRTQTETTFSELPDSTVDWYLRQAFERTVAMDNGWPSYEETWALTLPAGTTSITIPATCNRSAINSLVDDSVPGLRLNMVGQETAENLYLRSGSTTAGSAYEFSIWGDRFNLWPQVSFDVDRSYTLRGYRHPIDWIAGGGETAVDADPRLHYPMAHYAIALAYAQQEDQELEDAYMMRWQRDVEAARAAIMEPTHQLPLRLGGGLRRFGGLARYQINTP